MTPALDFTRHSLRSVMRPAPDLAPHDSVRRFLHLARSQACTSLPVTHAGRLLGVVRLEDLLPILSPARAAGVESEARARTLDQPVSEWMRPAPAIARADMTPDAAGQALAQFRLDALPVLDGDGYCLGMILAADLLAPDDLPMPRPARIGGMATPFGVYLTDGALGAGVGDSALVASGFALGLMSTLGFSLIQGGLWLAQRYAHLPPSPLYDFLNYTPPANRPLLGLAALGLHLLSVSLFLLMMRVTRLAGYHAAEHQTVHAVERNERLIPEVVARMPRAHPRCGTNLMAAGLLFFTTAQAFSYVPGVDDSVAYLLALLVTAFAWRRVGTFLQERLTTRPANARELASGIAAGDALLRKYALCPPARPHLGRRLWRAGLAQSACGMGLAFGLVWLLTEGWHWIVK